MVAIVLVNYNGANDTIDCVKSLQKLTYTNYKIIIVDNKSSDDSAEKLAQFSDAEDIVFLRADKNNGFSAGNNIGIQYALNKLHSDYIWLLNNDTVVEPTALSALIEGFKDPKNSNIAITTAKTYYFKNKTMLWYAGGSISSRTARTEHWSYGAIEGDKNLSKEKSKVVTFVSGCCMLIKREVFDRVGTLDEDYFLYEEDADYCLKVLAAGYQMLYCPRAIIYHKVNASTGKSTGLIQYYSVRNKYWLIKNNYKGLNKFTALTYSTLQMLVRCMKHELDLKYYFKGLNDYRKGKWGKQFI